MKSLEDPEIFVPLGKYFPISEIGEENWLREVEIKKDVIVFTVVDKETKKPIGNCGFHKIDFRNQRAEIGILIAKEQWGKGYAKEALELLLEYGFNTLNLHNIIAKVFRFNTRSIGLFKSIGFSEVGNLIDYVFIDGLFRDVLLLQLSKHEWLEKLPSF